MLRTLSKMLPSSEACSSTLTNWCAPSVVANSGCNNTCERPSRKTCSLTGLSSRPHGVNHQIQYQLSQRRQLHLANLLTVSQIVELVGGLAQFIPASLQRSKIDHLLLVDTGVQHQHQQNQPGRTSTSCGA